MAWETIKQRITDDLVARRADRWITGGIAVLLIALGFIGGRWTALSQTPTPIVFQEATGGQPSEASAHELEALVLEKKSEERKGAAAPQSAVPSPQAVKAATSSSQSLGKFVASMNGEKYYLPDCAEVKRIKEENKIWFDSEDEAKESGYEASVCVQKR